MAAFGACLLLGTAASTWAQTSPQEKQLLQQLNESRKEAGLPPLEWDERLADAARLHSKKMADSSQLGHVLPGEPAVADRIAATGIRFNRSAENVGYNSDFDDIQRAWMESPGHRENILNPNYTVVGIGVAKSDDGLYYATQDFAHAVPQRTAAQAEDVAAESFENLRQKQGHPALTRIKVPQLHDLACEMARTGKLDPHAPLKLDGVGEAVVYNNSLPEELPESARSVAKRNRYTKYAVGACFTGEQPNSVGGTFYVVMAFY